MDAKNIVPGELYAYVEYPKPYAHVTAQPNPIKVKVIMVKGDRVTMRRADARNFLVGSALVETHTVASRKIIAPWEALIVARRVAAEYDRQQRDKALDDRAERIRQIEEVLPYFEGIKVETGLDLEAHLRRELTSETPARANYVTLSAEAIVAVGRRIRELEALAAQNALDETDLEGWTNA